MTRRTRSVIAYRRVSTDSQGLSGVGMEGQLAAIEHYVKHEKLKITNSFQDVASGRGDDNLLNRPGLQAAIDEAKATGRPIICSGLDRISRKSKTTEEIVSQHGITIISAGDGLIRNPLQLQSIAARAQREGDLISQRTKEGLARKKAEGVLLGNRTNPDEARRLSVESRTRQAEQKVDELMTILGELDDPDITAKEFVEVLNNRGIMSGRNRPWTVSGIRRPLRSARQKIKEREAEHLRSVYRDNPRFGSF